MRYFSRVMPTPEAIRSQELRKALFDGYGAHRLIWSVFSDDNSRLRDFLFRLELSGRIPTFYAVSERPPMERPGFDVSAKPYEPKLSGGDLLRFKLRANPVVSKMTGSKGRGARHDVVMNAKRQRQELREQSSMAEVVDRAGKDWLTARAEKHGFAFQSDQVRADGYRQHRLWRGKGHRPVTFSTIDYEGYLEVTDIDRFYRTLFAGVGPSKAFGCGLLMIRRG